MNAPSLNSTTSLERCVMEFEGCVSYELIAFSFVFWAIGLHVFKYAFNALCGWLFSSIHPERAYLPDSFPVPHEEGRPKAWVLKVSNANESLLDDFLKFRKFDAKSMSLEEKRMAVAKEAVAYNCEVQDRRMGRYLTEKFTQGRKIPFPVKLEPWNGWGGFMAEIGSFSRCGLSGVSAYAFEHAIAGAFAVYALNHDLRYIRVVAYIDIGFNLADLVLMVVSMAIQYDISIYMGPKRMIPSKGDSDASGIFKLLAFHHLGAAVLELLSLKYNSNPLLCCNIAVAMLGTTGLMHCLAVLTDSLPIRSNRSGWFAINAFTLAVMVWYRALAWPYIVYLSVYDSFEQGGWMLTIPSVLFLGLFTLFNIDFIKFYWHKTQMSYSLLVPSKKSL
mmetsp:Transcript_19958/g.32894  ORF Transcript_19958/g.32894 Transcript_19958/m.32894 type:complete len:389 (+) Transcript_19958:527-1693(+)